MRRVVPLLLLLALGACVSTPVPGPPVETQQQPPARLVAEAGVIDVRDGADLRKGSWTLSEAVNPDIYTARLGKTDEAREICFISGANSLCRTVRVGDSYDFEVVHAGKTYPTRIVGTYVPPQAVFDAAYQQANRGRTRVSIPEVYELVNIAIALTSKAQEDPNLVEKETPYYRELMAYFAPVKDHPFVKALDERMRAHPVEYFRLKMNGYAFDYEGDRIVRSRIYNRTGFGGDPVNHLEPFLAQMQDFSDKSGFRKFYADHRPFYESQITYYRDKINIAEMLTWLRSHFPEVKPYDSTNIIFSPLVAGNQSVTWIESNGFRELQPHVNFPYGGTQDASLSPQFVLLRHGYIIFTELNHGFINPTADLHRDRILAAIDHRDHWATKGSPSDSYNNGYSLFTEMMNWGLVSLYLVDKAPAADRDKMIEALNPYMEKRRGFRQFPAFNRFLVNLYRTRPPGTTIAALYPQIIAWFEAQDDSKPSAAATPAS